MTHQWFANTSQTIAKTSLAAANSTTALSQQQALQPTKDSSTNTASPASLKQESLTTTSNYQQAPKLCLGDKWVWFGNEFLAKLAWQNTVIEVSASGIVTLKREAEPEVSKKRERFETRLANGNMAKLGDTTYSPDSQELAFPLQIGKSWKVLQTFPAETSGTITKEGQAKVVANEQLQTKAGSLDTYRIQQHGNLRNSAMPNWQASYQHTYWYSPAAKSIVKYEYAQQANRGGGVLRSSEITAFTVTQCD